MIVILTREERQLIRYWRMLSRDIREWRMRDIRLDAMERMEHEEKPVKGQNGECKVHLEPRLVWIVTAYTIDGAREVYYAGTQDELAAIRDVIYADYDPAAIESIVINDEPELVNFWTEG